MESGMESKKKTSDSDLNKKNKKLTLFLFFRRRLRPTLRGGVESRFPLDFFSFNVVALPPQELRGEGAPGGRRSPRDAASDPAAAAVWRRRAQGAPRLGGDGAAVRRERRERRPFEREAGAFFFQGRERPPRH